MKKFSLLLMLGVWLGIASDARALVEIKNNQLYIDHEAQPQLFGAELQYFRLRGGAGPGVPREKVIEIWERSLDAMVDAGMNAISFYIPWDFHEVKEGQFDFTGSSDYASRDVKTFIKMVVDHGFKRIMVRPGPYVNAEWGFLGFGAIPLWFHEKYPDSHMRDSHGRRTKLYDYHYEPLIEHTKLYFKALYEQVLKPWIGLGKPIVFVQLDNETNYMWQSLYNHDYGPRAKVRYREFLKDTYQTLEALNRAEGRAYTDWNAIEPPTRPGANTTGNIAEDQNWYRFADYSIATYLEKIRHIWEDLGVTEPDVLFTLAESYNATQNGLLPNFKLRNLPGKTGMMTMNMYPKTYELPSQPLQNLPFKVDHDVKAMDSASDSYLGSTQQWLMGPEIQGGWWRGINVSPESRKQTYLSAMGQGLKALFIYYFSEGYNWQWDWAHNQIKPLFDELAKGRGLVGVPPQQMPDNFWPELQALSDNRILVGIDVRQAMLEDQQQLSELYFDAPLDLDANKRDHFSILRDIGQSIVKPHGEALGSATAMLDPVALVKSSLAHVPSPIAGVDSVLTNSNDSGAIVGMLLSSGYNPDVVHLDLQDPREIFKNRVLFYQDTGVEPTESLQAIGQFVRAGGTWVNLLGTSVTQELGINLEPVTALKQDKSPIFAYQNVPASCETFLVTQAGAVVGFRCPMGKGWMVQIGTPFYLKYNSDLYGIIQSFETERKIVELILEHTAGLKRTLYVSGGNDRVTAFGRRSGNQIFVTIKNSLRYLSVSGATLHVGQRSIPLEVLAPGESRFIALDAK